MDRERLTITLRKSILARVDGFIDGTKIRNRSHAIEYLITQSLSPKIGQAVILSGGKGLKMRPFTYEMPKGLFPVGGKPILEHLIELLRSHEIRDVIFCIGYLGEKIRDHFGDGKKYGVNITYVVENKPAGTAGALRMAKKYLKPDTFLVVHGDILINVDLKDLIIFHKEHDKVGTIALTSVVDPSSFGEVILHGSNITKFIEKPKKGKQTSQLINCGMYVFDNEIFKHIPKKDAIQLEDIFPKLAQKKLLCGFIFEGRWTDIGTPKSYEKAIKQWGVKQAL